MSLDEATVAKIAHLARIRLDESQRPALAQELSNILGWVEQLGEVDTEGVPPMTSVAGARNSCTAPSSTESTMVMPKKTTIENSNIFMSKRFK